MKQNLERKSHINKHISKKVGWRQMLR